MAPNLLLWMLASGIVAGVMLYLSPIDGSSQVLASIGAVLFVFREGMGMMPLASTDEEALAKAMDAINKEIRRA